MSPFLHALISTAFATASTDALTPQDSDRDGLPDTIEVNTGTNPLNPDTDEDGVPDGFEDKNRNGIVDPHETDPRLHGLFPGSGPHIPEPVHFDLVRGLGARKGEVETNVLLSINPNTHAVHWAPEVEWALVDNFAVEFELPMVDTHLHALKTAVQWTAPAGSSRFTHGIQLIGEYLLDSDHVEMTPLYLAGVRVGPVSLFGMAGARLPSHSPALGQALVNPSVFYDISEVLTVGAEANFELSRIGHHSALGLGQLHWQMSRRVRLHAGGGMEATHDGAQGVLSLARYRPGGAGCPTMIV